MNTKSTLRPSHAGKHLFMLVAMVAATPSAFADDDVAARTTRASAPVTAAGQDLPAFTRGQLKAVAREAFGVVEAGLPDGAGDELSGWLARWISLSPEATDGIRVNHGELKAIARPFFDRLISAGVADGYPWDTGLPWADDEPATYAHVIEAFGFALTEKFGSPSGTAATGLSPKRSESQSSEAGSAPKASTTTSSASPKKSIGAETDYPTSSGGKRVNSAPQPGIKVTIDYPAPGEKL